jgi:hypothetical protein
MTNLFENDDPWQDRLSEYLDGLLTEPETRALEEHLQTCESCQTALAELRSVVERLHGDRLDPTPEGVWPRIASRLTRGQLTGDHRQRDIRRRSARTPEAATLRRIAAAASLTLTLAGGIWVGAFLCVAGPAWSPPGWMHLKLRESPPSPVRRPSSTRQPANASDSILDAWTPLRRSLGALDQQLSDADSALRSQPENRALQRVVEQLVRERKNLQALLDSVTSTARHSPTGLSH